MGEMADFYIDQMFDAYPTWSLFGTSGRRPKNPWSATCKHCGVTGLKWRAEANGWRLYENERDERNRLKEHNCRNVPATADEFESL